MFEDHKRIAELSHAVRMSILKRPQLVPDGFENWRPSDDALSFADIAHHLIEADQWLFRKLEDPSIAGITANAGEAGQCSRGKYIQLLEKLEKLGEQRASIIENMSSDVLNKRIHDDRFGGEVSIWWLIVRGNLDHETHHRGQIAVYLRLLQAVA